MKKILYLIIYLFLIGGLLTACKNNSTNKNANCTREQTNTEKNKSYDTWYSDNDISFMKNTVNNFNKELDAPISTVYISLADITQDNIPEFFCGFSDLGTKENVHFDIYSLKDRIKLSDAYENDLCIIEENGNLFDSRVYTDNSNTKYYLANVPAGNATMPTYFLSKIWLKNNTWFLENKEIEQKDYINTDYYESIATATVEVDPDNSSVSVEKCIEEYIKDLKNLEN